MQGKKELGSQSNHSFSDGTNLCINQTFSNKNELQLFLAEAAAKKSFDCATVKSCTKYLKVKCVSCNCAWMLRARKYECSDRFRIYKYIGEHSCGVEYANSSHRKISIKVIASLCVNMYRDGKGPNVKEIQRVMLNSFHCSSSYWKCWKGGVIAKEMVRGTAENRYSCLLDFSCMFETLNVGSRHKSIANSIVNVYNYAHHGYCMRHLDENLLVNHHCGDYLYLYYNAAKSYSLEEFDNYFVEFKNKYPAAAVVLEHDIGFEKWSRAHFPGNRYDMMTTNIAESLNVMLIDERKYPVESIFNSIAKRFGELFRERHAYILKSMGNQMVQAAKKIARKKVIEGASLYVENVTGDNNQFIVFGAGVTTYVNLLEKSCSRRKYDLIKIPCAHAMTALRSKHDNEYGMSIYEYFSPLYKDVAYLLAYMDSINVVPLESEWCVPEELLNVKIFPPLVDIKLGRKIRKRVKSVGENFKSKKRNKCSICKRTGHKRTKQQQILNMLD
ncbi:hypothetical protein KY284_025555 [Solanum tuberosum]|nr:hypothetical protein KY284_025555 [Solanum tuberosum]